MRIDIEPYRRSIEVLVYDNVTNADLLLERVKFNHIDAALVNGHLVPLDLALPFPTPNRYLRPIPSFNLTNILIRFSM